MPIMNNRFNQYLNNQNISQSNDDSITHQNNDIKSHSTAIMSTKTYDYILKFLLGIHLLIHRIIHLFNTNVWLNICWIVGDSDVGKEEILNNLDEDNSLVEPSFCRSPGVAYKATNILLDGKRIRLQVWYLMIELIVWYDY
jgi:hypothetical protein